ncbi:MAG: tyrosine-type recombinase/integrase, partial [Clostridia bacterium]|nr:tyrosine-type recombinase/integrase [Clostridia bacterium]
YISDDHSLEEGDLVRVPVGDNGRTSVVEIVDIEYFKEDEVPMPLDRVKKIIERVDDWEDDDYEGSPKTLDLNFKRFMDLNNLPVIRFHDLRHSYATFMLYKGVNPKIVCNVLGHSSVKVTLDLYSHPDVSMQAVCLDAWM